MNNKEISYKQIIDSVDKIQKNAKVFIYGSGAAGNTMRFLIDKLRKDVDVLGYINTYKSGKSKKTKIYKFSDFLTLFNKDDYDLILITSIYRDEICSLLDKNNINKYLIFRTPGAMNIGGNTSSIAGALKVFFKKNIIKVLNLFIRCKMGKFIIVGEYKGEFVGNSKYFFLYLKNIGLENVFWLIKDKADEKKYHYLKKYLLKYLSIVSLYHILSAEYLIFDNRNWVMNYELLYYVKAKKVQLWHGVGFKYIEKMLLPDNLEQMLSTREKKRLNRRYPDYDLLITTSEFYADNVFLKAFGIFKEKILLSGYPRNDVFYNDIPDSLLNVDKDIIFEVEEKSLEGYKLILYAPTFRDLRNNMNYNILFKSEEFAEFLEQNKIIFIVKSHAIPEFNDSFDDLKNIKNLKIYKKTADVYPLFKYIDLLITDYSSIYMDFLHLNSPILYYVFDIEEYKKDSRTIQFDYDEMTPGPKAKDFTELLEWISYFVIDNKDGFADKRKKIRDLAFKYKDGNSSLRIYNALTKLREKKE